MDMTEESVTILCECGHPRKKHVMLRARCTEIGCTCVHFEPQRIRNMLQTALTLDERLEYAERELEVRTAFLKDLLADEETDAAAALHEQIRLRDGIRAIINDPLSKREDVQSALLLLVGFG